ncbi:MAG: lactonase family protein [Gemmataceae bacterium]
MNRSFLVMAILFSMANANYSMSAETIIFVSSFAPGDQGAIQAFTLDLDNGALKPLARTTGVENPFFLALSPDKRFLYSIHAKKFGGKDDEEIASFQILEQGKLKLLGKSSTRGTAACYLDVDKNGKTVVVANYSSGSVASLPVKEGILEKPVSFHQHKGSSVNPARQKEAHAHSIVVSPDNKFAFAADLGLDQVLCYKVSPDEGKITPNDPPFANTPAGAGPRHLTFHPNAKFVYVINELLKYLFGTNRGHDSIACYSIANDGKLQLIGIEPSLGKGPQNLAITKDGKHLLCANMPGKNLAVFSIDSNTGKIKSVGKPTEIQSPSCIMILEK